MRGGGRGCSRCLYQTQSNRPFCFNVHQRLTEGFENYRQNLRTPVLIPENPLVTIVLKAAALQDHWRKVEGLQFGGIRRGSF
jgi:hypothetical protein